MSEFGQVEDDRSLDEIYKATVSMDALIAEGEPSPESLRCKYELFVQGVSHAGNVAALIPGKKSAVALLDSVGKMDHQFLTGYDLARAGKLDQARAALGKISELVTTAKQKLRER